MTGLLETLGLGASMELLSLSSWGGNLLRGLANSLQIAFGAFGMGLVIGLFGAYGKLYGGKVTRDLLAIYTNSDQGGARIGADPDPVFMSVATSSTKSLRRSEAVGLRSTA